MVDQKRRLTDILTASELTIDNVMVAWSFNDPGAIEVGPHPDYLRWSDRYDCTDGACEWAYKKSSLEKKLHWLLSIYYAAVSAGVDADFAHREFSRIAGWPKAQPPTDPATLETQRIARCKLDVALFGGVDPRPRPAPGKSRFVRHQAKDATEGLLEGMVDLQDLLAMPEGLMDVRDVRALPEADQYRAVFEDDDDAPGAHRFVLHSFEDVTPDLDHEDCTR